MSNMQVFYKKIKAIAPEASNPYLSSLVKLTHLDVARMKSLVTDLWWSEWGSPIAEPAKN